jgi:chromosome segregation ATPase
MGEIEEIEKEIADLESELSAVRGAIENASSEDLASLKEEESEILEDLADAKAELDELKK